jgi:pilus assembly protein Flp/PilA
LEAALRSRFSVGVSIGRSSLVTLRIPRMGRHARSFFNAGQDPMRNFVARLWREENAATSVEYAVMLALILAVILGAVAVLGQDTKQVWTSNNTQLNSVGFGS